MHGVLGGWETFTQNLMRLGRNQVGTTCGFFSRVSQIGRLVSFGYDVPHVGHVVHRYAMKESLLDPSKLTRLYLTPVCVTHLPLPVAEHPSCSPRQFATAYRLRAQPLVHTVVLYFTSSLPYAFPYIIYSFRYLRQRPWQGRAPAPRLSRWGYHISEL